MWVKNQSPPTVHIWPLTHLLQPIVHPHHLVHTPYSPQDLKSTHLLQSPSTSTSPCTYLLQSTGPLTNLLQPLVPPHHLVPHTVYRTFHSSPTVPKYLYITRYTPTVRRAFPSTSKSPGAQLVQFTGPYSTASFSPPSHPNPTAHGAFWLFTIFWYSLQTHSALLPSSNHLLLHICLYLKSKHVAKFIKLVYPPCGGLDGWLVGR
jgi:hypothetical protein